MKLNKKLVDEVIRLNKKYYSSTGNADILPAVYKAEDELKQKGKAPRRHVVGLIGDLAKFTQRSGVGTYEDIYKALAAFGIIVEEKEKENAKI